MGIDEKVYMSLLSSNPEAIESGPLSTPTDALLLPTANAAEATDAQPPTRTNKQTPTSVRCFRAYPASNGPSLAMYLVRSHWYLDLLSV